MLASPNPWQKRQTPYQQLKHNPALFIAQRLCCRRPPISPPPPPKTQPSIKIVCISDTHNTTPEVPDGDILLHTGDLTNKGSFAELQSQLTWLNTLPHAHKVIIAGNHDLLLDPAFLDAFPARIVEREGAARKDLDFGSVVYLNNESAALNVRGRSINVFGSPLTPDCGTWAFQYPPIRDVWKGLVPDGTDVLLTHGPPKGHLDSRGKGCGWLGRELGRVRPRLVVFGHIHEARGVEEVGWGFVQGVYDGVQRSERGWVSVLSMIILWALEWIWYMVSRRSRKGRATFVNAAVVGGMGNVERFSARRFEGGSDSGIPHHPHSVAYSGFVVSTGDL